MQNSDRKLFMSSTERPAGKATGNPLKTHGKLPKFALLSASAYICESDL